MARAVLTVLLAAGVATSVHALDESVQLGHEYTNRLLAMDDTASAHARLARWCQRVGLEEKAERHWKEVVFRDPDHAPARAALGQVRRGGEWVKAAESPGVSAAGAETTEPPEPTLAERRHKLTRRIRAIYTEQLGALDPATWREGADAMLMLRDPAAAEPLHRILATGREKTRQLMCEVLGQLPGREAARRLVRVLLTDPSPAVYEAALAAVEMRSDAHALQPLVNALDGSEEALHRAAHALGTLRAEPAVAKLIARLSTREPRVKTVNEIRSAPHFFFGTVVPYVADVDPVVGPGGAVAWDPVIGAIGSGVMAGGEDIVVTVRRTVYVPVRHPQVRNALRKITGRDFAFDEAAWRRWLREHHAAQ